MADSKVNKLIANLDSNIEAWQENACDEIRELYEIVNRGDWVHEDKWDEIRDMADHISGLYRIKYQINNLSDIPGFEDTKEALNDLVDIRED
jgi:hypothetical protein